MFKSRFLLKISILLDELAEFHKVVSNRYPTPSDQRYEKEINRHKSELTLLLQKAAEVKYLQNYGIKPENQINEIQCELQIMREKIYYLKERYRKWDEVDKAGINKEELYSSESEPPSPIQNIGISSPLMSPLPGTLVASRPKLPNLPFTYSEGCIMCRLKNWLVYVWGSFQSFVVTPEYPQLRTKSSKKLQLSRYSQVSLWYPQSRRE